MNTPYLRLDQKSPSRAGNAAPMRAPIVARFSDMPRSHGKLRRAEPLAGPAPRKRDLECSGVPDKGTVRVRYTEGGGAGISSRIAIARRRLVEVAQTLARVQGVRQ